MLLLASSANLGMAPLSVEKLQYDPIRDFAPIGRIARVPWALGVNARLPVKTLADLIVYAKANPGRVTGGSTGPGSAASFGIDALNRKAGLDILNVPYRASALAIQAVLAGEVDLIFTDLALLEPHVKAGTVRLLAAAGAKRLRDYPNLPTVAEQGVSGIVIEPWYGLVAPAGTPFAALSALGDALTRALRSSDIRAQMLAFGYEPVDETPQEFAAAIATDIARFSGADRSADLTSPRASERPAATPPPSAPSPAR
jgi:tripartite-type tricarboxylate transporter receptor subunit TctC